MKKDIFKVTKKNIKLIDFIKEKLNYLSNKKIKQYLKFNMIKVNNKVVNNQNYILEEKDIVEINYTKQTIKDYNIDIIYEDKDIIVINKPSGLLSISNAKEKNNTAFKMVREHVRKENKKTFLFTIHRLDEETSGVLMFAKNEKTKKLFQEDWNNIVKKRIYYAQVEGAIKDSGTFHTYLKENKQGKIYSTNDKINGKEAITTYQKVKKIKDKTLIKINILTGRRNQIRVHLSENNTPIIGDKKYGSKIKANRLMLHASILELIDPRTHKIIKFKVALPKEFYE